MFFLIISESSYAYDDMTTHPDLTIAAVKVSSMDSYLRNNLGDQFKQGIESHIKGIMIRDWLKTGSTEEDSPNCRASSHFLNPLKPWSVAGLSDTNETILGAFFVNPGCFIGAPFSDKYSIHKYSAVTWATGYSSPTSGISDTGNDMDWNAAREHYRLALTGSDKSGRENDFAKTFQALGQLMHLVQDMAVPAHVRNDFTAHLVFQKAGLSLPNRWMGNSYEWFVKDPANNAVVSGAMANADAVEPSDGLLTELWDADRYSGNNPSSSTNQGLAEYTNGNFFSESTIFAELKDMADIHYFPRPQKADTNAAEIEIQAVAMEVVAEDGELDNPIYVVKNGGGYKMAGYSFLKKWVENKIEDDGSEPYEPYVLEKGWEYNLDDDVYKDYAKQLLPRAVGYSAGLLNYFFRGEIDMVHDNSKPGRFFIENKSPEDITNGNFTLYYDNTAGNRVKVASWEYTIGGNQQSPESVVVTAPKGYDPDEKGEFILVFNGSLGREANAVAGKVKNLCTEMGNVEVEITGPDSAEDGTQFAAINGIGPFRWSIDAGEITEDGIVTLPEETCAVNVTVEDICGNKGTKEVKLAGKTGLDLPVYGSDNGVIVGDTYSTYGGIAPYTWSLNKGAITTDQVDSSRGVISSISSCKVGGEEAVITVQDSCGNTGTMDLSLGLWWQDASATREATGCGQWDLSEPAYVEIVGDKLIQYYGGSTYSWPADEGASVPEFCNCIPGYECTTTATTQTCSIWDAYYGKWGCQSAGQEVITNYSYTGGIAMIDTSEWRCEPLSY